MARLFAGSVGGCMVNLNGKQIISAISERKFVGENAALCSKRTKEKKPLKA